MSDRELLSTAAGTECQCAYCDEAPARPSLALVPGLLHLFVLVLVLLQVQAPPLANRLINLLVLVLALVLLLAPNLLPPMRNCNFWSFSRHTHVSGSLVLANQIQAQSQLFSPNSPTPTPPRRLPRPRNHC